MNTIAIVQARMGSNRLPGKVLMDIAGQTALSRVIGRLSCARYLSEIVVATTISPLDDLLVQECRKLGVPYFRGAEQDVLSRYCKAAAAFHADVIVRITSDCPLIDPGVVDNVIAAFHENRPDLACNELPRTFPRGLDTEVFTIGALQLVEECATRPYQREHVTSIFYERQDIFRIHSVCAATNCSHYRLTLDTAEDLQLIRAIYSQFDGRDDFTWQEVVELLMASPGLAAINGHVLQKPVRDFVATD